MKSKKMLLILVFGIALAIGWIVSVRSATGTELLDTQRSMIEQGDAYMSRQLFVRAISCYESALSEESELRETAQEHLLEAYLAYKDMSSYISLVEERIAAGTAVEEEYLNVAAYYVGRSRVELAIPVLKQGIEQLQSETLKEYYEANRYTYRIRTTSYAEILPTASNTRMPAFNGEKWGFADENGREAIGFIYDFATAFNDSGWAVVQQNGTYYSILSNGAWYGADDESSYPKLSDVKMLSGSRILGMRDGSYSYFNYDFAPMATGHQYTDMTGNACGVAAVQKDGKWGIISDSGDVVVDFRYEDVAANSLGCAFAGNLAMVKENGSWHLIDIEGNTVGAGGYADAKAPESTGYIAVADENGKWGYIDRAGNSVIPCQYNDALSFSQHLGAVRIVDSWGYISEENELVIDGEFQSAAPFHNGIAQVGQTNGCSLLVLEYFED